MKKYYVRDGWNRRDMWRLYKTAGRGGDRCIALGMSEKTARRIARLLNEDEENRSEDV